MITPYSHFKNIPISIIFTELNVIGKQLLSIFIIDYNAESMLFYPGKKLVLDHLNLLSPLKGEFVVSVDGKYYILLDQPLTYSIIANTNIVYNTTFKVDEDNEAITTADLLSKYTKQKENYFFDGIEFIGSSGLLSPIDYSKLKNLSKRELFNFGLTFSNLTSYQFIGAIKVDYASEIFKHKFGILGDIANIEWELSIPSADNKNISIKANHFGYNIKCGVSLRLQLVNTNNGDSYILIEALLESLPIGSLQPNHNVWHETTNRLNVLTSQSDIISTAFIYETLSVEPSTFGTLQNNFKFDKYLKSYNKLEPLLYLTRDVNIANDSDLNTLLNLGNYFGLQSQVETIVNKPTGLVRNFRIEIKPMYYALNNYAVLQTLYSYDSNNKPLIFSRLITNLVAGVWENINDHKVLADNVTTTTEKQFVSQTQVNLWNATTNLKWKNPVSTFSQLFANYPSADAGFVSYVVTENMVYIHDGINWEPQTKTANITTDGIITASMYNEFFYQPGHSKKINEKNNTYCHRLSLLSSNDRNYYGNNVLDLVSRISITKEIQDNTIGIGSGTTTAYGLNSISIGKNVINNNRDGLLIGSDMESTFNDVIGIGNGLKFISDKFLAIGQFNLAKNENIFEIGNGTSDTSRSNLFAIDVDGYLVANGLKIEGGISDEIWCANGSKRNINDLVSQLGRITVIATGEFMIIKSPHNEEPDNNILEEGDKIIGVVEGVLIHGEYKGGDPTKLISFKITSTDTFDPISDD